MHEHATAGVDSQPAIRMHDLGIRYRRYRERVVTLKDRVAGVFCRTRYEEFWALRDISLTIKRGERVGIIGPNGAGKSTFLKAIAEVLPPTTGVVETRGRVVPLIELGAGFNEELTGRENIFLNAAILGIPRRVIAQRIEDIISFAELEDFIDIPLRNYSSGMKARLGFAVAADVEPDIILLDEIFSVGDEAFRRKSAKRMQDFFDSNKTVISVSHSLENIVQSCSRAVYLCHGMIVADGESYDVVQLYRKDARTRGR